MAIIVGSVVEKNGKYLLVQEAQEKCYGKWNLPAGHLDPNETIAEGAKREAKEETGCDIEVTGICQLGNRKVEDRVFMTVIFTGKLIKEETHYDTNEILDVKWFSYEELVEMQEELRSDFILNAIEHCRGGIIAPLEIIHLIKK